MIAVDTNILVYAHRKDFPHHQKSLETIQKLFESDEFWCIPWPCISEFYSVVTNPKIFKKPEDATSPKEAFQQINSWLESPGISLIHENELTYQILQNLVISKTLKGPAVHDARIYAICASHRVESLCTFDRDFSKMSGSVSVQVVI